MQSQCQCHLCPALTSHFPLPSPTIWVCTRNLLPLLISYFLCINNSSPSPQTPTHSNNSIPHAHNFTSSPFSFLVCFPIIETYTTTSWLLLLLLLSHLSHSFSLSSLFPLFFVETFTKILRSLGAMAVPIFSIMANFLLFL